MPSPSLSPKVVTVTISVLYMGVFTTFTIFANIRFWMFDKVLNTSVLYIMPTAHI